MPVLSEVNIMDGTVSSSIKLQTSRGNDIVNKQNHFLLEQEISLSAQIESKFESNYQGKESPFYNCHGLTFASKRTGIDEDEMIMKILEDEYIEIKEMRNVIEGDVVVYYVDENYNSITHSGIVIERNRKLCSKSFPSFTVQCYICGIHS